MSPIIFSSSVTEKNRSIAPLTSIEKTREIVENFLLPKPEKPDIVKYMFLLRSPPASESPSSEAENSEEKGELVGWTQTNRWGEHGLEMGYFMIEKYTGKGYVTEGVRGFLELFWTLPGMFIFFASSFWHCFWAKVGDSHFRMRS